MTLLVACTPAVTNVGSAPPVEPRIEAPAVAPADLETALRANGALAPLLDAPAEHRLQVLVGIVDEAEGQPTLRRRGFRVDAEYFYPASAIKLCTAVAALEVMTELREGGTAELEVDAASVRRRSGPVSVANLVSGALVMSDNEANNDLFDLAGFDGIHQRMWRIGLSSFRMHHRLGIGEQADVRITPRVDLFVGGRPVASVPAREGRTGLGVNEGEGLFVGESHLRSGRVVAEPLSFEQRNRISLADLQDVLVAVIRPELRGAEGPRLGARERQLLVESLEALPSSRGVRAGRDREYKPLRAGVERVVPRADLTYASKSGRAYGFSVETAYAFDRSRGRGFFVAATLYTNPNGRLNDDLYDYDTVAVPAMADIGEAVARHVLEE